MPARFDLQKIRRNWEFPRPGETASARPPAPPPPDPLALARDDLAQLESLVATRHASHRDLLDPFVQRVRTSLDAFAAALAAGTPLAPLRDSLDQSLFDLEDLLEVVLMLPP